MPLSKYNPYGSSELISLLNTVLDVDHWGIVVVNKEEVITFVNNAYAAFFNKEPQDMIGKKVNDAYVNSAPSGLPRVLSTGQPDIGKVYYLNGRYVVANRYPIYEDGKVVGAVGKVIFRDIDEFNKVYAQVNKRVADIRKSGGAHPSIKYTAEDIVGNSVQMVDVKEAVAKISLRNSTVLIRGESGTGKELVAQAIHNASQRRNYPFVKVNCAAIPEHLLESELFGYADGAFTGARKGGKKGKFELADKGTIFLDEIGDMSFNMQAKLLRVLQEKEIEPLGSHGPKEVNVRIIAATNVNLEELIKYNKFREDLFYRLNVVSLHLPALRERKEDIDQLVKYFIQKFNFEFAMSIEKISAKVMDILKRYRWPGNVRELENVVEQAFNFVEGNTILYEHLPHYLIARMAVEDEGWESKQVSTEEDTEGVIPEHLFEQKVVENLVDLAEREMIVRAMLESAGNKSEAARKLGISRPSLYKKLAKYKIC